jgi:ABC transporter substrate binding protein
MSSLRIRNVLITLFIVGCAAFLAWWNASKPRILILQSYDPEYVWSRELDVGIRRVLEGKAGYSIRHHYMDTKRHASRDFLIRAGINARRVVDEWRPDLVIAVDDDAQEYVMKNYVDHPGIRIVFAGLNGEITPYGYDRARNATGILERIPWHAIKDALLASDLRRTKRDLRLLHIGDNSQSALEDAGDLKKFHWAPLKVAAIRHVGTFGEWKAQVEQAAREADVLLIGNYRLLAVSPGSKELVDPKEVVAWTEKHSKLPLIGFKVAYGEEGGSLAISASPYEQGEVAARMALRILEKNVAPKDVPIESSRQFVVSVQEARALRLPPLYEAFARATNTFR